jgi:hypothetical protein
VKPELYHVGILVFDLETAVASFSVALDLAFEDPRSLPLDGRLADNHLVSDRELRVSYSTSGAMRLELIEAQEDGVWGRQHGEGVHHIGAWHDDPAARLDEHRARGHGLEACIWYKSHVSAAYLEPAALHGVRLELLHPFPLP